jgi:hypothetical protein
LPKLKDQIANLYQFPTKQETEDKKIYVRNNLNCKIYYLYLIFLDFNQYSNNIIKLKLVQKRRNKKMKCSNERMGLSNLTCFFTEMVDPIWNLTSTLSYPYESDSSNEYINGKRGEYNNAGYAVELTLTSPIDFYAQIDDLIKNKWVDEDTVSVLLINNFYFLNHDLFILVRILYENLSHAMEPVVNFGLLDITPLPDNNDLIVSIVFSIFCLVMKLINLIKPEEVRKASNYPRRYPRTFSEKFVEFWKKLHFHIESTFRFPEYFEWLSKIF